MSVFFAFIGVKFYFLVKDYYIKVLCFKNFINIVFLEILNVYLFDLNIEY